LLSVPAMYPILRNTISPVAMCRPLQLMASACTTFS
jgi:hypothetical protein